MPPVARLGDTHDCPKHGKNAITAGGTALVDDMPIARLGDPCGCGATITEGSGQATDDGLPVAYVGCKTSCGGVISDGSPSATVAP